MRLPRGKAVSRIPKSAADGLGEAPLRARERPEIAVTLGLDAGTVRVGLAATDPTATIAGPVATLSRRDGAALWARVREEARARGAERLVVGLPRRLDGSEGEAAAAARAFADEASRECGLPVEMWDERLTTVQAQRSLNASEVRGKKARARIDEAAACAILQAWIDARRARQGGS